MNIWLNTYKRPQTKKAIIVLLGVEFVVREITTHAQLCSEIARISTRAVNVDIELRLCKMGNDAINSWTLKLNHKSAERVWDSVHLEDAVTYTGMFRPLHPSSSSSSSSPHSAFSVFVSASSHSSPPFWVSSSRGTEKNNEIQWIPATTSTEAQIQLDGWRKQEIERVLPVLNSRQKHTINLVASLRQLTGQPSFASKKFVGRREETETAAVVLDAMLSSMGVRMSLNNNSESFATSVSNAMGGTTDFGGVHMLLYPEHNAQFIVKTLANFEEVTSSPAAKARFARQFELDIASALHISPDHVRVQEFAKGSTLVKYGLTGQSKGDVKQWADSLQAKLADRTSKVYSGRVTSTIATQQYSYQFVPVFHNYKLSQTHFNASWNRDYSNYRIQPSTEDRGNFPFFPPAGWYRHALNVSGKYSDESWLGMSNASGEWPVAYHGTKADAIIGITQNGLRPGDADLYKYEAYVLGAPKNSKSIYVAPDVEICEQRGYAREFEIDVMAESGGLTKAGYKIAFMCRINPATVTMHWPNILSRTSMPPNEPAYWRMWDPKGVRPYGLLLKQTK